MSRVVAPRKPLEANDSTAAATNRLRALVASVISLKGILHEQVLTGMADVSNAKQPLSIKQALSHAQPLGATEGTTPMPEAVIVSTARSPIGRAFKGSLKAVSYTHLRAHETDSYLVCRLLLEKKKQQLTYNE